MLKVLFYSKLSFLLCFLLVAKSSSFEGDIDLDGFDFGEGFDFINDDLFANLGDTWNDQGNDNVLDMFGDADWMGLLNIEDNDFAPMLGHDDDHHHGDGYHSHGDHGHEGDEDHDVEDHDDDDHDDEGHDDYDHDDEDRDDEDHDDNDHDDNDHDDEDHDDDDQDGYDLDDDDNFDESSFDFEKFFEDIQETFKDQEELEKVLSAAGLLGKYEEYRPKPKPTRRPNMFSNLFRGFSNRNQQIVVNRESKYFISFDLLQYSFRLVFIKKKETWSLN